MTLLWRNGDPLADTLQRLHAIQPDPSEGREPRDAMLPQFDGLDRWIARPIREAISAAVSGGAITLQRVVLADGEVTNAHAREYLAGRRAPTSLLYGAARGVVADWERRGIDPCHGHLHGADIHTQRHSVLRRVRLAVLHLHPGLPDRILQRGVAGGRPPDR